MYITNNCGHLYCLRCLRQIKRCVKCHKTINIKDLIYIDITKKSTKHIDLFQKEIDKLRRKYVFLITTKNISNNQRIN